jgi:glycosyltransferase involved in cell wall biosynthesis
MKVLVSAYACDPFRGGEFSNGWGYAYNAVNGISVWCLTTTEGKESINRLLESSPIPTLHIVYVEIPNWIRIVKEQFKDYGVYFHYWYFQKKAGRIAKRLEKEIHFDVVHHATYSSLQLGSFLWRMDNPMLFGPVGGGQQAPKKFRKYFYKWWSLEKLRDLISTLLLRVIGSPARVLKKSGITLVVNQETYEMAHQYGAKKIMYAPCTLLPDAFGPSIIQSRNNRPSFRLLWVGRLIARKGLRVVLEALAQVDKAIPFTLTIIGDGVLKDELPLWIEELDLVNRVTCEGLQPLSRVHEAYDTHDVFIYCSLRESFASQIFESMSYGLPLIVFNLHGVRTFVPDDAAWKIEVNEPEQTLNDIRNAVECLFHHPERRLELGANAFQVVKEFTWSKRIKLINEFYDQLANSSASGKSVTPNLSDSPVVTG